jgi:NADPH-dependent 2,4-dienoyl-CoA reductase/sulfur reductase-like enzyme
VHVAIIGNGVAGVSAAREIRRRDPGARITLISGESDAHWSRPALMYLYLGHLRWRDALPYEEGSWAAQRIDRVRGWVTGLDLEGRRLELDGRRELAWDRLLIATGSVPRRLGLPGESLDRVSGLVSLQDLEALERWTPAIRRGVVVGGGLIGVELAEMLHGRGRAVTLIARESDYWNTVLPAEEAAMVSDAIRAAGVDLRLSTEVDAIEGGPDGGVAAVRTRDGARVEAQYVGVTVGVQPNLAVCAGTGLAVGRGVRVDATLRTSHPDVYAAGDCAEIAAAPGAPGRVEAVWYTSRAQGEVAGANLCGAERRYEPGIWFNSAKFFDLEHQVYGTVPSAARPDPSIGSVFWRDEAGRRSVRICHRDGAVVGFNLMGVRYRHRVCEAWIREGRSLDHVLGRLREASFDPEFARRHDAEVRAAAARGGSDRLGER